MITLGHYLALSAFLFGIGAIGFLSRRNVLIQLMCIEIMLNSVNLTLVAFNRWLPETTTRAAVRLLRDRRRGGRSRGRAWHRHQPLPPEEVGRTPTKPTS